MKKEYSKVLQESASAWNQWRKNNPDIKPDLSDGEFSKKSLIRANLNEIKLVRANFLETNLKEAKLISANLQDANLSQANLGSANLNEANLIRANLIGANLKGADLSNADLGGANLMGANLSQTILRGANLSGADLYRVNLSDADLTGAILRDTNLFEANLKGSTFYGADLRQADFTKGNLEKTNLSQAILTEAIFDKAFLKDCRIFGISASNISVTGMHQSNLIISQDNDPTIMVNDLLVGQFLSLLLDNPPIRSYLENLTINSIMLIGSFLNERIKVLEALHTGINQANLLTVSVNFNKSTSQKILEKICYLANSSLLTIVDFTVFDQSILENFLYLSKRIMIPIRPILAINKEKKPQTIAPIQEISSFILETYYYKKEEDLFTFLKKELVPASKAN